MLYASCVFKAASLDSVIHFLALWEVNIYEIQFSKFRTLIYVKLLLIVLVYIDYHHNIILLM